MGATPTGFFRRTRNCRWWIFTLFSLLVPVSVSNCGTLVSFASRTGKENPENAEETATTRDNQTPTQSETTGENEASSSLFSFPLRSSYVPPDNGYFTGAFWDGLSAAAQADVRRHMHIEKTPVSCSSVPPIAIPVCIKPHVDIFLEHAFNLLVYRQQQYLLRESRRAQRKKETEKESSLDAEKRKEENKEDDPSVEERNFLNEGTAVKAEMERPAETKRVTTFIVNGILCALLGKPCDTWSPSEPPLWKETSALVNPDEDNSEENLFTPRPTPAISPRAGPQSQYTWSLAYTRLLQRMLLSVEEDFVLSDDEKAAELSRLRHLFRYRHLLDDNGQLTDLASRLQSFGLLSLRDQPESAALYLSLLIADENAMSLWRQHLMRHVWQCFPLAPCDAVAIASRAAAVDVIAAGPGTIAERKGKGGREKGDYLAAGAEEGEGEEEAKVWAAKDSADFALFSATWRMLRGSDELASKRRGIGEEGERGESREGREPGEGTEQGNNFVFTFRSLLASSSNWRQVYDPLLTVLQREFWMARPASSAAAVQMIAAASQLQQHAGEKHKHMPQTKKREEEEEKELLLQQARDKEEKAISENRRQAERTESSSSQSTSSKEREEAATCWEAEVSLRFRYLSMKDAQKMMGTFLTSNLHPEMNFPMGHKLAPQSSSSCGSVRTGKHGHTIEGDEGGAETNGGEERGGGGEDEAAEDEGEGELPETFDARAAFPACRELIGHVRDQGNCGCCWAFSSTTSLNDRLCIKSGGNMKVLLSPQHTTSCCDAVRCASFGCDGGEPGLAWRWFTEQPNVALPEGLERRQGVVTGGDFDSLRKGKTCWPYEIPFCSHASAGPFPACRGDEGETDTPVCRADCEEEEYTKNVHPFAQDLHRAACAYSYSTPAQAKRGILRSGSISASFLIYEDFLNYKGGVYKHIYGMPLGGHAVKVIGWGVENGEEYWLVVNSWNTYWGDDGLFKIKLGDSGINDDLLAGDVVWRLPEEEKKKEQEKEEGVKFSTDEKYAQSIAYREL